MVKLVSPLQAWLEANNRYLAQLKDQGFKLTPDTARKGLEVMTLSQVTDIPNVPEIVDTSTDIQGRKLPLRVYHPQPDNALPVLVFFHGGGHMCGSVEVYDPICRKLALATNHVVVAPDYRLAPEHPYPAGLEDGWALLNTLFDVPQIQALNHSKQLSIAGDSGGGAMTATLAHRAAKKGLRLEAQVLIYPSLDYTMSQPSIKENGEGYLLEIDNIRWYFEHYFAGGESPKEASPLYMEASRGLPRTLAITAGFDPLRDEGRAYVERLQAAGIEAQEVKFDGLIHAFLNLENLCRSECRETYAAIGRFLNVNGV